MDINNPAWFALIISILGTVFSPLITTYLTNKHQYKMKKLEIEHTAKTHYLEGRRQALNDFIAKTGTVLLYPDNNTLKDFGNSIFIVYQYVPKSLWKKLDTLYFLILSKNFENARELYPLLIYEIAETLAEDTLTTY